jgi:hypothetical protein
LRRINSIIIHCSDSDFGNAIWIDRIHREDKGFDNIGYHYVICRDGRLETGRDIGISGAHAYGFNQYSVGICLIGKPVNDRCRFTVEQLLSAKALCNQLMKDYNIETIYGHRNVNNKKVCPGMDISFFKDFLRGGTLELTNLLNSLYGE